MKKIALISLAAALAMPAVGGAQTATATSTAPGSVTTTAPVTPAAAPAATMMAPAVTAMPAAAPAMASAKKVELKDGSWAQVEGDNVTVSKDGGKTWTPAPDGVWDAKDGSKVTTKSGKLVK